MLPHTHATTHTHRLTHPSCRPPASTFPPPSPVPLLLFLSPHFFSCPPPPSLVLLPLSCPPPFSPVPLPLLLFPSLSFSQFVRLVAETAAIRSVLQPAHLLCWRQRMGTYIRILLIRHCRSVLYHPQHNTALMPAQPAQAPSMSPSWEGALRAAGGAEVPCCFQPHPPDPEYRSVS